MLLQIDDVFIPSPFLQKVLVPQNYKRNMKILKILLHSQSKSAYKNNYLDLKKYQIFGLLWIIYFFFFHLYTGLSTFKANHSPLLFKFIRGMQSEVPDFLIHVCSYVMLIYSSFSDYWTEAILFSPCLPRTSMGHACTWCPSCPRLFCNQWT